MKKVALYTAVLSLSYSLNVSVYALGLGDMTVNSYLDQVFDAEIELIDVGNTPLSGIKASLASIEDYQRVGLEQIYAVTLLTFQVEKNKQGKPVIKIHSLERLSEPFFQLLIDLAWAEGQLYRSYSVLLDPPDYQLTLQNRAKVPVSSSRKWLRQGGVIEKPVYTEIGEVSVEGPLSNHVEGTYGPTRVNETIWQIAQHYKLESVLLQQTILAIVGSNPEAFTEGNLNGLKVGSKLRIPSGLTASKVPSELAKLEVLAHDKAWQTRVPIEHALLPPYINGLVAIPQNEKSVYLQSELVSVPYFNIDNVKLNIPTLGDDPLVSWISTIGDKPLDPALVNVSEPITSASANLKAKLLTLQASNDELLQELSKNKQELKKLRMEIQRLHQQKPKIKVLTESKLEEKSDIWTWLTFILLLSGGSALWYWRKAKLNQDNLLDEEEVTAPVVPPIDKSFVSAEPQQKDTSFSIKEDKIGRPLSAVNEVNQVKEAEVKLAEPTEASEVPEVPEVPEVSEASEVSEALEALENIIIEGENFPPIDKQADDEIDEHVIEFEPMTDLDSQQLQDKKSSAEPVKKRASSEEALNALDFEQPVTEAPAKSKVALDTLLALTKTYISMGDEEAARQSLEEVLAFGTDEQKAEAKELIDKLNAG